MIVRITLPHCPLGIASNNVDSSFKDTGDDIANYLCGLDEINFEFSTKRIDVVICDHSIYTCGCSLA